MTPPVKTEQARTPERIMATLAVSAADRPVTFPSPERIERLRKALAYQARRDRDETGE